MKQPNYIHNIDMSNIEEIILIEKESYLNPWNKNHFKNDILNKLSMNYMYKKNKEIRGYLFGHFICDEYHLNKITVKKKYRYKKIGKSLFLYCLSELINNNIKSIHLEVSSLNLIAQKFYKNMGFVQVGLREKYYSKHEDALLYSLDIR